MTFVMLVAGRPVGRRYHVCFRRGSWASPGKKSPTGLCFIPSRRSSGTLSARDQRLSIITLAVVAPSITTLADVSLWTRVRALSLGHPQTGTNDQDPCFGTVELPPGHPFGDLGLAAVSLWLTWCCAKHPADLRRGRGTPEAAAAKAASTCAASSHDPLHTRSHGAVGGGISCP